MDIKTFKEKAAELQREHSSTLWDYTPPEGDIMYHSYETGGVSGGSCWDESDPRHYYHDASEKDRDFTALEKLLLLVCPDISFLRYKDIVGLVEDATHTDYEYYGNCTDYNVVYIDLDKLHVKLTEIGAFPLKSI